MSKFKRLIWMRNSKNATHIVLITQWSNGPISSPLFIIGVWIYPSIAQSRKLFVVFYGQWVSVAPNLNKAFPWKILRKCYYAFLFKSRNCAFTMFKTVLWVIYCFLMLPIHLDVLCILRHQCLYYRFWYQHIYLLLLFIKQNS